MQIQQAKKWPWCIDRCTYFTRKEKKWGDGALYVLSHQVSVALVDQVNGYQDISEIERFLLAGRFWQCFLVLVNVMINNDLFLVIVLVIEYRAITGKLNILLCFCNFITHDWWHCPANHKRQSTKGFLWFVRIIASTIIRKRSSCHDANGKL